MLESKKKVQKILIFTSNLIIHHWNLHRCDKVYFIPNFSNFWNMQQNAANHYMMILCLQLWVNKIYTKCLCDLWFCLPTSLVNVFSFLFPKFACFQYSFKMATQSGPSTLEQYIDSSLSGNWEKVRSLHILHLKDAKKYQK